MSSPTHSEITSSIPITVEHVADTRVLCDPYVRQYGIHRIVSSKTRLSLFVSENADARLCALQFFFFFLLWRVCVCIFFFFVEPVGSRARLRKGCLMCVGSRRSRFHWRPLPWLVHPPPFPLDLPLYLFPLSHLSPATVCTCILHCTHFLPTYTTTTHPAPAFSQSGALGGHVNIIYI